MSWKVVDAKWSTIREAFNDFQIGAVAAMDETAVDALTDDKRVIRNRRKLQAIRAKGCPSFGNCNGFSTFQLI
jgi:3-methyladenine DNA glycosylase Tag